MHRYFLLPLLLAFGINLCFAQEQKSLKESWADLKKSFKPDKAFLYPSFDSTNTDLQAFLQAVRGTKNVNAAILKMTPKGVVIEVDTKGSMVSVWNNLPVEIKNRYTVSERTNNGFVLKDNYSSISSNTAYGKKTSPPASGNSRGASNDSESVYEQVEKEVNENYKPDTSKKKSVWDQQKEYADSMRERNRKRSLGLMDYENPKDYDEKAAKAKGSEYIEYKINGKPFGMYSNNKTYLSTVTSRVSNYQEYKLMDIQNNKYFFIRFTNPAVYPDVRKFEFGKPTFKTTRVGTYDTYENENMYFSFEMRIDGPNISTNYNIDGSIKPGNDVAGNIVSGNFEIIYFEPGRGGIIDAKFNMVVKGGKDSKGNAQPDLVITDGRLRARMK